MLENVSLSDLFVAMLPSIVPISISLKPKIVFKPALNIVEIGILQFSMLDDPTSFAYFIASIKPNCEA